MTQFLNSGFTDSFRYFNNEPNNYTWWSYRANARVRNLGWRIDYEMISNPIVNKMKRAIILPEAKHSDHCPVLLEIDF
jgi:exodeoxyribonuclease-3